MKRGAVAVFLCWLAVSGCTASKPVCPPEAAPGESASLGATTPRSPAEIEIGGRIVVVDRVVEGLLCDDAWNGTVYVGCGVEVRPWEGSARFLEGCDLSIAPGTIVYVADHNNTAYYNGCSCHTGELSNP